jgi:hypothetical protein
VGAGQEQDIEHARTFTHIISSQALALKYSLSKTTNVLNVLSSLAEATLYISYLTLFGCTGHTAQIEGTGVNGGMGRMGNQVIVK